MSAAADHGVIAVGPDADADVDVPSGADRGAPRYRTVVRLATLATTALGLAVAVVLAATTQGYLSIDNGRAILVSASIVGILAVGETVIMISGRLFSLSLAISSAVAAMTCVSLLAHGLLVAVAAAVVVGVGVNAVQGFVIGAWQANPIIVTIAAGALETGIGAGLTGSHQLTPPTDATSFAALADPVAGVPVSVYVFIAVALIAELAMRRTTAGIGLYLMGDSLPAARAAGVRTIRLTVLAFAVAGLCAALAGVLLAATNGNASLSLAGNNTYSAITAALVGGTLVTGGSGSIVRTLLGAVGVTAIADLVLLRGYSSAAQLLVEGLLVLLAVVLVHINRRTR